MNRRLWIGLSTCIVLMGVVAGCTGDPAPPEVMAKKFPGQAAPKEDKGGPAVPPKPTN